MVANKKLSKYVDLSHRFHSCYTFINSFIVSLSIKGSLIAAFDYVKLSMDKEYNSLIDGLANLKEERLDYLKKYFPFDIYYLFLSIINIYQEQGGDILALSTYLISESRQHEDYLLSLESIFKRKVVEFASLWIFTLVILIILRFSLNQFYPLISVLLFFQISIAALFLVILLSIHLMINKYVYNELRGFENAK